MKADADCRLALLVSCVVLVVSASAHEREQPDTQSSLETRDEREAFLSNASFVTNRTHRRHAVLACRPRRWNPEA